MNIFLALIIVLIFIVFLSALSDHIWVSLYRYTKSLFQSHTQRLRQIFETQNSRGQKLMRQLYELERVICSGRTDLKAPLAIYKHYTPFLFDLLELNRTLGIPLKDALSALKKNLKDEQQFSRQWESLQKGGLAQIVLLFFISWGFFESSRRILEQDFRPLFSLFLASLQLTGLGLYLLFIKYLNKGPVGSLRILDKMIQQLRILKSSGLSSHKVLELVKLEQCDHLHRSQHDLRDQLLDLIVAWRESGVRIEAECQGILEEIEFRVDLYRQKALTQEKGVKFLVFAVFFVVPYFLFLGGLMTSLFH